MRQRAWSWISGCRESAGSNSRASWLQVALKRDRTRRQEETEIAALRERFESLTPREREVLPLVVSGRLNKQNAADLGTSEITIKVHRASIMRKMQAESLADLVRMAGRLGIPVPR